MGGSGGRARLARRQAMRMSARRKTTVPQLLWVWVRVKRARRSGTKRVIQRPKPSWKRMSPAIAQCSARVTQPQPAALSKVRKAAYFELMSSCICTGSTGPTSGSPPVEPKAVRSMLPVMWKPASNRPGSSSDGP